MNRKTKILTRMLTLALSLVVALSSFEPACAQKGPKNDTSRRIAIPKDKQPKLFLAWIGGAVLAAAIVAVGMKNSRRTHLD